MKPIVSISAAMLLAVSVAACGQSDDQSSAQAGASAGQNEGQNAGDNPTTNTASENSESSATETASTDTPPATQSTNDGAMSDAQAAPEDTPKAAVAVLHGTQGNDDVMATVRFTPKDGDGGLAYTTTASGLAAGKHGYHIHLYGDCSSGDGKSAGTHFNLQGSSENPPKDIDRITGDLGDLEAGDDGSAKDDGMLAGASLTGAKSIIGRGIIIHEKPNDPSQPPIGAAGSRQACGVIGIAKPQTPS